jgi:HKD family nuclease
MPQISGYSSHFQPERPIIDKLVEQIETDEWNEVDVPVAYARMSGVKLLQDRLHIAAPWLGIQKRFLIGIDWFRSDPIALDTLSNLPNSEVRIVDGEKLITRKQTCIPFRSYHPKAFIFKSIAETQLDSIGTLAGSGNLSRNGLLIGRELDLWISNSPTINPIDSQPLLDLCTWFNNLWDDSTEYEQIKDRYRTLFEKNKKDNKKAIITEDDSFPAESRTYRGLKPEELNLLRSFDNLWINTGSMYSNLGNNISGNQLDMKRYTRVFFGFPAEILTPNSSIGSITIEYNGHPHLDKHLRFGDNTMDKLYLPLPGNGAPDDYRSKILVFSRKVSTSGLVFNMKCEGESSRTSYRRKSLRVKGLFKFGGSSEREFGVF